MANFNTFGVIDEGPIGHGPDADFLRNEQYDLSSDVAMSDLTNGQWMEHAVDPVTGRPCVRPSTGAAGAAAAGIFYNLSAENNRRILSDYQTQLTAERIRVPLQAGAAPLSDSSQVRVLDITPETTGMPARINFIVSPAAPTRQDEVQLDTATGELVFFPGDAGPPVLPGALDANRTILIRFEDRASDTFQAQRQHLPNIMTQGIASNLGVVRVIQSRRVPTTEYVKSDDWQVGLPVRVGANGQATLAGVGSVVGRVYSAPTADQKHLVVEFDCTIPVYRSGN